MSAINVFTATYTSYHEQSSSHIHIAVEMSTLLLHLLGIQHLEHFRSLNRYPLLREVCLVHILYYSLPQMRLRFRIENLQLLQQQVAP